MKVAILAIAAMSMLAASAAQAEEYLLEATLKGATEVPPGDPAASGIASATLDTEKLRLCYTISSQGLVKATMAHIHKGAAGVAGDVVVTLTVDNKGNSKDCMDVPKAVADAIAASPGDYYVNVHSDAFPKGAIRGQLAIE